MFVMTWLNGNVIGHMHNQLEIIEDLYTLIVVTGWVSVIKITNVKSQDIVSF